MSQENKTAEGFGMPWEDVYGYAQAVKKGNTVWISGQLGHNEKGELAEGMEAQMIQSYANIKELLSRFELTMDNVVEEVIYAMDMTTAFEARKNFKTDFYSNPKLVASSMIGVSGLALPGQLVEIKIIATV
ncbi:Rid family hydrolase [Chryseobacterium sp. BIGb0232]|uniref:Rid family hydrolase n=1 Tax=Chryseobacterium sp. BIGb0232 TaxID=2940598 RepID=UPI000F48E713|nr:Rid family hydrolase [Chryseobacterium sp. BIGb0232]MCS4300908.1 enamine deaminase RidA (YjgF/YER057c/UK114 family) [Chryseobacterium sp. BIGb0232]ROS20222.1 enamine deaminase RidA (YjgF/YER057c/UK114 family) [Chryseobacterium nakagawai]